MDDSQDRFCTPPQIHTTQQRLSNKAILEDTDGCDNSDSSRQKKSRSSTLLAVFDFDTLDCLVCMEPLSSQIIQCCNGHYVCQPCIAKINGKCPTCLEPIGKIRNLGLEKIIESLKVQCEFARLGCEEMLQYKAKKLHEQDCPHRPHDCPLDGCGFRGHLKDFSLHFMKLHEAQTVHFKYAQWFSVLIKPYYHYLLLKSEDDKLFIFHNQKLVLQGINALYLAVLHTAQGALLHNYCIVAKTGTNKVCLESRAVPCSSFSFPCSPLSVHTVEHSSIDLLLVPSGSIASLTVELYICRIGESISSWS